MSEWKALTGRTTLFLSAPGGTQLPSAYDLYKLIWDEAPDSFQKRPNAVMPEIAQGERAGIVVNCAVHPTRIDFTINPKILPPNSERKTVNGIVDLDLLKLELQKSISFVEAGRLKNGVFRVAVSVHFISESDTVTSANKRISSLIPKKYRPELLDEEDFSLQLNFRNHESNAETLNFIKKWSVERFQVANFQFPSSVQAVFEGGDKDGVSISPNFYQVLAASVLVDNNSLPGETDLTVETQGHYLRLCFLDAFRMQLNANSPESTR